MLKIGLIGVGFHGRHAVIPALARSQRCVLAAACDLSEENLQVISDPAVTRYRDWRKMLADGGFDAIYVATLEETHHEIVIAALTAGYHVLCEKPMAMNTAQCREMIAVARRTGMTLAIGFEKRYHPEEQCIRDWIRQGRLGEIQAVHFQNLWDAHKTITPLAKRRAEHLDRSGALDCGIHDLDLARFYVGGGTWANVTARGRWFGETDRVHAPHISLIGELDSGLLVTLTESYAFCANIEARLRSTGVAVVGTAGAINWHWDGHEEVQLKLANADGIETVPIRQIPHSEAITSMLDDFAAAAAGEPWPESLATADDGLIAQEIVDEALQQSDLSSLLARKPSNV